MKQKLSKRIKGIDEQIKKLTEQREILLKRLEISQEKKPAKPIKPIKKGGYIYFIKLRNKIGYKREIFLKIGISAELPERKRLKNIERHYYIERVYLQRNCKNIEKARDIEKSIKQSVTQYIPNRRFAGWTECFKSDEERTKDIIQYITEQLKK